MNPKSITPSMLDQWGLLRLATSSTWTPLEAIASAPDLDTLEAALIAQEGDVNDEDLPPISHVARMPVWEHYAMMFRIGRRLTHGATKEGVTEEQKQASLKRLHDVGITDGGMLIRQLIVGDFLEKVQKFHAAMMVNTICHKPPRGKILDIEKTIDAQNDWRDMHVMIFFGGGFRWRGKEYVMRYGTKPLEVKGWIKTLWDAGIGPKELEPMLLIQRHWPRMPRLSLVA